MRIFKFHLILLPIAVIAIIPLAVMIKASLMLGDPDLDFNILWTGFDKLSWQNIVTVWETGGFSGYFLNSVIVSFLITVGNIFFDSMVAYALARRAFKGKNLLYLIISIKLMIPAAVLFVPTFQLMKFLDLYNTYPALILPLLAETFGIYVLKEYIAKIPISFEEAAVLEGASTFRIFYSIILPICTPALSIVAIHSILTSWNMYIYPLILTSSDSIRTLPLGISFYERAHPEITSGELMATAFISAVPVFLAFLIFQRRIIKSMTQGALKE